MNRTEGQITKTNPLATGLVVGLGWGLVFGFLDGLPILLELPILPHLRVRLQALTYLMVWYGSVSAISFGLLGLVVWGLLRLLGSDVGRRRLVAIYSGSFIGLASLAVALRGLTIPLGPLTDPGRITVVLLLTGLGGVIGLVMGLGIYGGARWWQEGQGFLRPLRWKLVRGGVVTVFLAGVIALSAVGIYRTLGDLAVLRPRPSGLVATPEQPNVVLITIDALRADHLGIYGYDPEISPHIDALAGRGVAFEQAISQAPWTAPSVASFITSLSPAELGVVARRGVIPASYHVDEMRVTLADVFRDAGYRTVAYAANPFISHTNGFAQGFDHLTYARHQFSFDVDALHERILPWLLCTGPARATNGPVCDLFTRGYMQLFDRRLDWEGDRWITEFGTHFLRLHKDERFFLWLFYVGPHAPYNPPQPFRPLPDEITPQVEQFLRSSDLFPRVNDEEIIRPADLKALVSLYDGEIAYTDELVGQVLNELDRLGLTDRTLVVLLADHGEEFADHGGYGHVRTLYDELVHVPFIVSGPGVEATGRRVETQVSLLDMVPTVCDLAGLPIPEEAEGRSLVPFLEGQEMEENPTFSESVGHTVFERKAIRRDGYKLIYDVERGTVELYDLQADPHEQTDLSQQKPEIVETMLADLQARMVHNAKVAAELPRLRPISQEMDDRVQQLLRDAGY
jgi:arylsulfatase A-like enzyme